MLDHIGLSVSDLARSRAFYEKALAPLGYRAGWEPAPTVVGFVVDYPSGPKPDFWLYEEPERLTYCHVAFAAPDRPTVDAFYAAAIEAGAMDNGPPGVRDVYHEHYYGAFVFDPDGSNIEAVCHLPPA
jgi:catechol 2,3-dioxygenase-like lactoylglutathione lyase family enzyme